MNRRGFFGAFGALAGCLFLGKKHKASAQEELNAKYPIRVVRYRPASSEAEHLSIQEIVRQCAEDCKGGRVIALPLGEPCGDLRWSIETIR